MNIYKNIIAVIFWAILASSNLSADNKQPIITSRMAARAEFLKEERKHERLMFETVNFENDIPDFLKLDAEFAKDPQYLEAFLNHFDFTINNERIPVYQSKPVTVRKDKPFTFSIKAKRGKLESLLALVKTTTQDWIKSACAKALNFLSFRITYDCPLLEHNIHTNNTHLMGELIYEHSDMREILKNPSNIMNRIKQYLTWSEWFGVEAKLPELKYQDS